MVETAFDMGLGSFFRHGVMNTDADGGRPGENGLYGGQLEPLVAFLFALAAVLSFDPNTDTTCGNLELQSTVARVWGTFIRAVGALNLVTFASLAPQLLALGGSGGLFPVASMLEAARHDLPTLRRWISIPVLLLWLSASDAALLGLVGSGIAASCAVCYGGSISPLALCWCWATMVQLSAAVPLIQYPWDVLLMETTFACATLLPPLVPLHHGAYALAVTELPSWPAVWHFRLLLLRLMLGMAKFKFSSGWAHGCNALYLKWFLSWQPLPTPMAWRIFTALPMGAFSLLHRSMYVVEVLMPALFVSSDLRLRCAAAAANAALQVAIHASGNYGVFNLLTIALTLPLVAPSCNGAAGTASASPFQVGAAALLAALGALHFPHNSYTTNAWPFAFSARSLRALPFAVRLVARPLLALMRLVAPFHIAHGYGVFTPLSPRNVTHQRRILSLATSDDGGATWRPLKTRWGPSSVRSPLRFFAPHQPRLDHHLYYEGMDVHLEDTSLLNPYYASCSPGLLPRLLRRLLECSPPVLRLLADESVALLRESVPTHIRAERLWVRFASPAERSTSGGAPWVLLPNSSALGTEPGMTDLCEKEEEGVVDLRPLDGTRHTTQREASTFQLPRLASAALQGWWADWKAHHPKAS